MEGLDSDVSSTTRADAVQVRLTLREAGTDQVVVSETHTMGVGNISQAVLRPPARLQVWSPQTPVTYTLTARIIEDAGSNGGGDEVNVTSVGVRVFDWNRTKARLNGRQIELQGFSHHPSFAGMGAMTSPRLALFLAQVTKALGVRNLPSSAARTIHYSPEVWLTVYANFRLIFGETATTHTKMPCMKCSPRQA
jgi:beta-galactosidase/beta-glucuronidase